MYDSLAEHFAQPKLAETEPEKPSTRMSQLSGKTITVSVEPVDSKSETSEQTWQPTRKELWMMITCAVSSLVVALDATILVPVLPTLAADLKGSSSQAFWTGTSYLLAHSVLQPFMSSLSDIFGRREVLIPGILFFLAGSVVCGIANNFTVMLVGRVIQGIGGAIIIALSQLVFADLVPLRQRPKYFSLVLGAWAVGSVLGPLIGGVFVEKASWRWCFYLNIPILGVALPMAFFFFSDLSRPTTDLMTKLKTIDWTGNTIFITSTTWVLIAISWAGISYKWSDWQTLVPLIVGLAGVVVAILYEYYLSPNPFLSKRIFAHQSAVASYIAAMLQGLTLYMGLYYISFYFSAAHLFSPIRAGLSIFPATTLMLPGSVVVSALITRFGRFRWAIWVGFTLSTLGNGLMVLMTDKTKTVVWATFLCIFGLGMGMILSSVNFSIQAAVEPEDAGSAAAMYAFMRSIGMCIGVAVGGTVFQNEMKRKLLSFLSVDQAVELAKQAEGYIEKLKELSLEGKEGVLRQNIMSGYVAGFRGVWITMTALCAAGLVVSLFIKRGNLDKVLMSKFQVRDKV